MSAFKQAEFNGPVTQKSDVPLGLHYQVIVFDTVAVYTPPYDYHDGGRYTSSQEKRTTVYAFTSKDQFNDFVDGATRRNESIVIFKVECLGKATISVNVDVDVK